MLPALHRLADDVFAAVLLGDPLYVDGFGDERALSAIVDAVRIGKPQVPIDNLQIVWEESPTCVHEARVRHGRFDSPAATLLPAESRVGQVELLTPGALSESARPPVVLVLAATAEVGYARRRRLILPLVHHGIAALLLENPYYGPRRPADQRGTALRTVRDQFAMNLATVYEATALLHWLRRQGYEHTAISGYSQGGFMAAFAAVVTELPVAAVPLAAGSAALPVFTQGGLSRGIAWKTLAAQAGSLEAAHGRLCALLAEVDLKRFPAPQRADAAVLVAARHDRFVSAAEAEALHAHWPGSELRWREGSHVTEALFGQTAQRLAIGTALDRLRAQQPTGRQTA